MSAILSERGGAGTVVVTPTRRGDVNWAAIFVGWILSFGVAWLLYLLGSAIGLTAVGVTEENIATGLAWSTAIWIILTWGVSMYVGGYFAGRLSGNRARPVGGVHGVAVWALATVLGLILATMTTVNVLQAGQSLIPGASVGQALGGAAQGPAAEQATGALQAQIKQALSEAVARTAQNAPVDEQTVSPQEVRRAIDQLSPTTLAMIAGQLMRGNTAAAENTLVVNTPLSRTEVNQIIQGMSATVEQAQQRALQAADQMAEYTAAALWTLFASSVLGLAMAAWGGWMGGRRAALRRGTDHTEPAPSV